MIEVSRTVFISRPVAEVTAQFGDVAHHARTGLHRGVTFVVVDETPERCVYEQVTRMGPARIHQSFHLDRDDPTHQVNVLTSGAFSPGSITFDITPEEGGSAVTATLRTPRQGLRKVFAPILRRTVGHALAKALTEDRADLESGHYRG